MNKLTIKNLKKHTGQQEGFTLIELLIVIVIITALAVTVFVALNPVKRTQDARNSRRASDVETVLTSIHEYIVDNAGVLPLGIALTTDTPAGTLTAGTDYMLGVANPNTAASCPAVTTGGCNTAVSTCKDPWTPGAGIALNNYLKSMPFDPLAGTTYSTTFTGYAINVSANHLVTIKACGGENGVSISQSR